MRASEVRQPASNRQDDTLINDGVNRPFKHAHRANARWRAYFVFIGVATQRKWQKLDNNLNRGDGTTWELENC